MDLNIQNKQKLSTGLIKIFIAKQLRINSIESKGECKISRLKQSGMYAWLGFGDPEKDGEGGEGVERIN
jgi:hypothetical protein